MLYPLKFRPVFKDYIWGGRNLKEFGKDIPEGITAESWEISCHPDGKSVVANGIFKGIELEALVKTLRHLIIGTELPDGHIARFPLLVKFIDAEDRLSVQVHPDDDYAFKYENGDSGKNEMWYVVDARPGAEIVYGTVPGITRESFEERMKANDIESALNYTRVHPGDVINIPAGAIHAIGEGIVIAEIQQSSNLTYRVYDYERTDKYGNKRPLHLQKALEVTDFGFREDISALKGLAVEINRDASKVFLVATPYFLTEKYEVDGFAEETADGGRFYIFICLEGGGKIVFEDREESVVRGESVLIPAALGKYRLEGKLTLLRTCVPDIEKNILKPLTAAGYTRTDILREIKGISAFAEMAR